MKRRVSALTDDLRHRLSGEPTERAAHLAIQIITTDADGWPHPAMLSYFEVVAADARTLRLAVYGGSGTADNLRARGRMLLLLVDERLVCYIRGQAREVAGTMRAAPFNALFEVAVEQVVFDDPSDIEAGAFVTSGITYHQREPRSLDLARAVLAELRQQSSGG